MAKSNYNQVRIIAGEMRGRKIHFATQEGLRPTSDRLRETLFNWLQNEITNCHALDLFAGSGALGFEAISRGAMSVTFIEKNRINCDYLKENIERLKIQNAKVLNISVPTSLTFQQPINLVFIDPPFALNLHQSILDWLVAQSWLAKTALIYLEIPKNQTVNFPSEIAIKKETMVGSVHGYLLQFC